MSWLLSTRGLRARRPNLKSVALALMELLAFKSQILRGHTWPWPLPPFTHFWHSGPLSPMLLCIAFDIQQYQHAEYLLAFTPHTASSFVKYCSANYWTLLSSGSIKRNVAMLFSFAFLLQFVRIWCDNNHFSFHISNIAGLVNAARAYQTKP